MHFEPPPDRQADFWDVARRALRAWEALPEVPLRFRPVEDPERADVEFRWIERFATSQAGTTHRQLNARGRIERVTVVLARTHVDGTVMSDDYRQLVALHEVGHVVGLPHSGNPGDVMHPGNRNLRISPRDRQSVRALYSGAE